MACKHKPQDPRLLIATGHGRYLLYFGLRFLPTIPVTIAVGLALWTWHLSGGCMTWKAVDLGKTQDDKAQETSEAGKIPVQRNPQTDKARENLNEHTENTGHRDAACQPNLPNSIHQTNRLKMFFQTHTIGVCVVIVLLVCYIMIPVLSRMAPPFHVFHLTAEDVKEISIWKSDENNSVVSSYTMDDPEEIEEMVEKLNDVHFYFWVLLMPSGKEGYGLEIQEKDNSKEVFEVQPHTVSIGFSNKTAVFTLNSVDILTKPVDDNLHNIGITFQTHKLPFPLYMEKLLLKYVGFPTAGIAVSSTLSIQTMLTYAMPAEHKTVPKSIFHK